MKLLKRNTTARHSKHAVVHLDFLVDRIFADMGGEIPGRTRARLYTEPGGTNSVDQHLLQELFVISFPVVQTTGDISSEMLGNTVGSHHRERGCFMTGIRGASRYPAENG